MQVFRFAATHDPAAVAALRALLADDERARAARFRFDEHRARFIVFRARLREVLAAELGADPRDVRFDYGERGKPRLAAPWSASGLEFNLSHSADRALLAVTRGRPVGIDLERTDRKTHCLQLAERFFSQREVAALLALPAQQQRPAFFTCWTRKEAYIKARGEGLALPLADFAVSLVPDEPAQMLWAADPAEVARWRLAALDAGPGFAAALCVAGPPGTITTRDWP